MRARGYRVPPVASRPGAAEEVETILEGHPHLSLPGSSIEVLELLPMDA